MNNNKYHFFTLGMFFAIGMAVCGYFIGQTMYNAKVAVNTAQAKGLAERMVHSDVADWKISYSVSGKNKGDVPGLYSKAEENQKSILKILTENGFNENEISIGVIDYSSQIFRDKDRNIVDKIYSLSGFVKVTTDKVESISGVRNKINKLIVKGISIQNHAPRYRYTKLNDIKPEMLREATRNARISANEFAKNAGVSVGGIRTARQGNFDIRDFGEQYGDRKKIKKTIRVVTTITFYLTD